MVTRLPLPHTILVSLHVHKADVVVLTPETVGTSEAMDVARSTQQGAQFDADIIYLLHGAKERSEELIAPQVRPTPTQSCG